jgi:hypothetical protein
MSSFVNHQRHLTSPALDHEAVEHYSNIDVISSVLDIAAHPYFEGHRLPMRGQWMQGCRCTRNDSV